MIPRRPLVWVAFAEGALVGRLLLIWRSSPWSLNPDGVDYIAVARMWEQWRPWGAINAYRSPLYSWVLLALHRCGLDYLAAARVVGIASCVLLCAITYPLALAVLRSRRLAAASVALLALPPTLNRAVLLITPDILTAAMVAAAMLALTRMVERWRPWQGAIVGGLAGLSYLAKAYCLPFFALLVPLCLLLPSARRTVRRHTRRSTRSSTMRAIWPLLAGPAGRSVGAALLCMALVCAPWVAAMHAKYGRWTFGSAGKYNWLVFTLGRPLGQHNGDLFHPGDPMPPGHPRWNESTIPTAVEARRVPEIALNQATDSLKLLGAWVGVVAVTLAGYAVAMTLAEGEDPGAWVLFGGSLLYALGYLPMALWYRYAWGALPAVVTAAVLGVHRLARDVARKTRLSGRAVWAVVVCITVLQMAVTQRGDSRVLEDKRPRWQAVHRAGLYVGAHSAPGEAVLSHPRCPGDGLYVSFYGQRPVRQLSAEEARSVVAAGGSWKGFLVAPTFVKGMGPPIYTWRSPELVGQIGLFRLPSGPQL